MSTPDSPLVRYIAVHRLFKVYVAGPLGLLTVVTSKKSTKGKGKGQGQGQATTTSRRPSPAEQQTLAKFNLSLWKFTTYGFFTTLGLWVVHDEPYLRNPTLFWSAWASPMAADHRLLYLLELAYYLYDVPALLFFESKRKDFLVMVVHHLATIILIAGSLMGGFHKVGVTIIILPSVKYHNLIIRLVEYHGAPFFFNPVNSHSHSRPHPHPPYHPHPGDFLKVGVTIMVLHDVCDVFLEAAKVLKYTCKHTGRSEFWVDRLFEVFVVVWVAMRDVYFPFWVIRSCLTEAEKLVVPQGGSGLGVRLFTALLCVLQVLHVWWTYLIARIAYRQIVHGVVDDDREDD
jgi:sphingoid base N-palmitoyltransferase